MSRSELEVAAELLRNKRFPEAIERLRSLLSIDPDDARIRARVADAYRLAGNEERAFHHFNRAAAIYTRQEDHKGAYEMLYSANEVTPNQPDILYRMAEALKPLQRPEAFERALRDLIRAAHAQGDRRRVWAIEELHQMHPGDLELAVLRAEALGEAGRINEAVEAWKELAAELDRRGVDYMPAIRRAAALAPQIASIGVDLARLLLERGHPREALSIIVPSYEETPDDIGILQELLAILVALDAKHKILPARIELLKARAKRGQRDEAFEEMKVLLQIGGTDPAALEVCAHTCAIFGERRWAAELWQKVIRLYGEQGRLTERTRAVSRLLKVDPRNPEALALGATVLREAGRPNEALALERKLADLEAERLRTSASRGASVAGSTRTVPTPAQPMDTGETVPSSALPRPPSATETAVPAVNAIHTRTVLLGDEDVLEVRDAHARDDMYKAKSSPADRPPSVAGAESLRPTHQELVEGLELPTATSSSSLDAVLNAVTQSAKLRDVYESSDHEPTTARMGRVESEELADLRTDLDEDGQSTAAEDDRTAPGLDPLSSPTQEGINESG